MAKSLAFLSASIEVPLETFFHKIILIRNNPRVLAPGEHTLLACDASAVRVELDEEPCIGFFVEYDTGETAEVSWSFVRELPPKNSRK